MIYGFAYLMMVLAISAGWIILAVLKKPDFIEKPLGELKNKIIIKEKKKEMVKKEENIETSLGEKKQA